MHVINLRSDTQTFPTAKMLEAMTTAPLGDDTYDEDPTVHKLEAMAAALLGKEAALLTISGHMANLCALLAHAKPGEEVILDQDSHIFYYELGSMASVGGLMPFPIPSHNGALDPDEVRRAIRGRNLHYPVPRVLCLENTHNRSGGRSQSLEAHRAVCRVGREAGLKIHLDGARIFNAAVRHGVRAADFAAEVDSLMFCLSKGLSCPLGSLLVGSRDFIAEADRRRKLVGGGMRQAGVIAACGIVALEEMIERLADDHANARRLAEGIKAIPRLAVDLDSVETNMVNIDHAGAGLTTEEVVERLKRVGVLASSRPPRHIRLVTHRHYGPADIDEALGRIADAMR
ncbi:MAG: aminotransferase class I/II-fold pyridoxal phosphate-dependent enzyme [Bryobacterales bacterium]|nr:aminotransferase class I/II-fold pyridoxal phosphate-dependent enzyme [Bryobacterales bacterium]